MAKVLARISGTALLPGVSKNGRLYTRENIAKAVTRAQARLDAGAEPVTMLTHHDANDDSGEIVGRLTRVWQEADGRARYDAEIADTGPAQDIANLADTSDDKPAFLKGVSIRGYWAAPMQHVTYEGQQVTTADDVELDGLDFTRKPGVTGAAVEDFAWARRNGATESAAGRIPIYESAPEAHVSIVEEAEVDTATAATESTAVEEKGAPALKSGKPAAAPTKATKYADPGYQDDKAPRYALDNKTQAKAAWSYINVPKNAKLYTANQLKRVKQRILAALKKFGVKVDTKEHWVIDSGPITESASAELREMYGDAMGGFRVELNNGPIFVTIGSYCIDPADLDVIGRAAMAAACDSLKAMDPDMDGDIDIDGAPSEDNDNDMESAPTGDAETSESATQSTTEVATEATKTTAPATAADPTTETEALVSNETTAVEQAATTTPAPGSVTLSGEQFAQLLAAVKPAAVESAPATPAATTEVAPAAQAATTVEVGPAAAAVTETPEQMVARLVAEGIAAALPQAVQAQVEAAGPRRKGLIAQRAKVGESVPFNAADMPDGWPTNESGANKQLHELTRDELGSLAGPSLLDYVTGSRG